MSSELAARLVQHRSMLPYFVDTAWMTVAKFLVDTNVRIAPEGMPYVRVGTDKNSYKLNRLAMESVTTDERVIAECVHLLRATETYSEDRFTMLSGRDIMTAYEHEVGGHSCMTATQARYTAVYADNPETVQLLVLDGSVSRALLWNTIDGHQAIDRIYPNSGENIYQMLLWAMRHNAWRRAHQGAEFPGWCRDATDEFTDQLTVKLRWPSTKRWPWIDSFRFCVPFSDNGYVCVSSGRDDALMNMNQHAGEIFISIQALNSNAKTKTCTRCNKEYVPPKRDYYNMCPNCIAEVVHDCVRCGTHIVDVRCRFTRVVMAHGGEGVVCQECRDSVHICDQCNRVFVDASSLRNVYAHGRWCGECVDEHAILCDECGDYVHEAYWDSDTEMCDDCRNALPDDDPEEDDDN